MRIDNFFHSKYWRSHNGKKRISHLVIGGSVFLGLGILTAKIYPFFNKTFSGQSEKKETSEKINFEAGSNRNNSITYEMGRKLKQLIYQFR